MGACLSWKTYKTNDLDKAKAMFEKDQESDRYENGHCYSGGIGMLDSISNKVHVFTNQDGAVRFVADNAQKFEDALVTRYKNDKGETEFLIGGLCSS